ncbi:MAG: fatty acid oxidation complex subunit alpha FadJ [Acidimicrobiia bacterium]|nr:fatty acid oxidation complex subunit alpha FadJ [Acidimicrobiia bacterium]NNF10403.1 fatty acid oxidation complex subunit alpha FadJ [Acidimicrobiia bacterium]NNL68602.1 fatty acid oxidation complex subunit alpha FadJ [Acidimicrobiia bacterium]
MDLTHFTLDLDEDGIATVLMDRAGEEMNTLAPELSDDLAAVLDRLEQDPAIRGVVLGSAKPANFHAGADIRAFADLDETSAVATLQDVQDAFDRIEGLTKRAGKPVVAAIHGACLGGGLELALACSARISSDDEAVTQFGQPEVKLGLLPGAGGTQRLPRLIGIAAALDLILSGRTVRPRRAHKLGLVDAVVPADQLLGAAHAHALAALDPAPKPPLSLADRAKQILQPAELQSLALERNPLGRKVLFAQAEKKMLAQTRGNYPAPPAALECVRIGFEEGIEAGLAAERAAFARLVNTPESRALRSIFFATQELKRDTGTESDAEAREISTVGVLGGGLMGGGITAVNTTRAGVRTVIKEVDAAGVARGIGYVQKVLDTQVKRRRMQKADAWLAMQRRVEGTENYDALSGVDIVIEAVFEDLNLKRSVLADVERVTRSDTIFASNTSSIPIGDIAAGAERPGQILGMHYFSPVEKMPLLEVIVTDQTEDWVTATAVAFGKRQGKTVIVVNDAPGFYTTRILGPYSAEVLYLLEDGATVEEIDGALKDWGFPVGPVTLSDEVGIDVGAKIGKILEGAFGERMAAPPAFAALIDDDRKGRKNGRGFYQYEDGKKGDVDESVYAVLGVEPRPGTVSRREIQDRLSLQMVNEAVRCLEDGVLRSARDGDIGAVMGLGFPPFRGGPFRWVDQLGPGTTVETLQRLAKEHGSRFDPAPLLVEMAADGSTFHTA